MRHAHRVKLTIEDINMVFSVRNEEVFFFSIFFSKFMDMTHLKYLFLSTFLNLAYTI